MPQINEIDWWTKQLGRRPELLDDADSPDEGHEEPHARDSRPERRSVQGAPSPGAESRHARQQAAQVVAAAETAAVELRIAAEREASDLLEQARRDADRVRERVDHETREQFDLAERRATERPPVQRSIPLPETDASGARRLRVAEADRVTPEAVSDRLRDELYALIFSPREPYRRLRRICAYNLVLIAFALVLAWLLVHA